MDLTLGHFGDLRLKKGGPSLLEGCLSWVGARCEFDGLEAAVLARCGSRVFCAMPR